MENLSKENFFNNIQQKYPEAFAHFSNWIDEYKKQNNWQELFGWNIKFHHLPFEMQNGILIRYAHDFMIETEQYKTKDYEETAKETMHDLVHMFSMINKDVGKIKTDAMLSQVLSKQDVD